MLLDIPNETCAGLKKLSTWFGMRSLQKNANILCEWVSKKNFYGRAKRGDGTAKDGRKTERSSAPYAEACSPRFCEYMFEFGLDKFLQKKITPY